MNKPTRCCGMGEYGCTVPMPINHRVQHIDFCVVDIVAALNAANIKTTLSCCGHDKLDGAVHLEDGREIIIQNMEKPG